MRSWYEQKYNVSLICGVNVSLICWGLKLKSKSLKQHDFVQLFSFLLIKILLLKKINLILKCTYKHNTNTDGTLVVGENTKFDNF